METFKVNTVAPNFQISLIYADCIVNVKLTDNDKVEGIVKEEVFFNDSGLIVVRVVDSVLKVNGERVF